jgi:Domain of unknown function (DUF4112)
MATMDEFIAYFAIAVIAVAAVGVAGYFVLRRIFTRSADRMAQQIESALNDVADIAAADPRFAAMSAAAARVASGRVTNLGAYAAAQGISEEQARAQFARTIERVARIMDSAIRIPIIGGVGLDALLGLVPIAGDAASAAVSISMIARSIRFGIPRAVVTKMLANVLVDFLLGAIPVVGDLADLWFRANQRNAALLKEYLGAEASDVIDAEVVSRSR